jgi:GGDEF domain-containing protein
MSDLPQLNRLSRRILTAIHHLSNLNWEVRQLVGGADDETVEGLKSDVNQTLSDYYAASDAVLVEIARVLKGLLDEDDIQSGEEVGGMVGEDGIEL